MGSAARPFEFHASLTDLEQALSTLHRSVELLRDATGRPNDDRALVLFETALGEIGANVMTHGRPGGHEPVAYALRVERGAATASFSDRGPAVRDQLAQEMPDTSSESGRGLAIARALLDEFGYERLAGVNTWRLVKRL